MVFSWWPPLPSDYEAYADAGFNLALLRGDTWLNKAQEAAYAESEEKGKAWRATHYGLFEAILEESGEAAKHGIMSVFTQVNLAPEQEPIATQAYGNRTGAHHFVQRVLRAPVRSGDSVCAVRRGGDSGQHEYDDALFSVCQESF